ncbi:hypothetical protein ACE4WU_04025 [Enterococcus faecalis]|uniref:hypothetical protein n=1 Tax=Enterococcus faecalis TaxID=1351 RepID=UPI0019F9FA8C|nr:hypothetical protein [Enterococcus faecalis]EGO9277176.1 hypothetical protein [Enterococcus faecalis]
MKTEPNNTAILWRFGIIGICLHKVLHKKQQWLAKWYIFTHFMGTFFIFFTFLFMILFSGIGNLSFNLRLVILTIVLLSSVLYGWWAETYFHKFIGME